MDTSLEALLAQPIGGNADVDSWLLNALQHYALDKRNPMPDRAKAIRHLNENVMGILVDAEMSDEALVKKNIADGKYVFGEDFYTYYPHCER